MDTIERRKAIPLKKYDSRNKTYCPHNAIKQQQDSSSKLMHMHRHTDTWSFFHIRTKGSRYKLIYTNLCISVFCIFCNVSLIFAVLPLLSTFSWPDPCTHCPSYNGFLMDSKWRQMKISISTPIKIAQINGMPHRRYYWRKDGMEAPRAVHQGHTRHRKYKIH